MERKCIPHAEDKGYLDDMSYEGIMENCFPNAVTLLNRKPQRVKILLIWWANIHGLFHIRNFSFI